MLSKSGSVLASINYNSPNPTITNDYGELKCERNSSGILLDPNCKDRDCTELFDESTHFDFTPTTDKIYLEVEVDANLSAMSRLTLLSPPIIMLDNINLEAAVRERPKLAFFYDDRGQRIRKETYYPVNFPPGFFTTTTYYVRDASGSVMAIYNLREDGTPVFGGGPRKANLAEHPIYGSSRLGVHYRQSGTDAYQLTDHLGNVRAVIMKNGNNAVSLTAKTDYYPFGMPMPNRNVEGNYRYRFQGQEKDSETGKEAFELRLWDSRIGRWLTVDPAGQYASPYLGMGNNPISSIDPDGGSSCGGEGEPPCPTQQLDAVDLGTIGKKGFDFSGIPNWMQSGQPDWWNTSFTGNLSDYNNDFGTDYTEGNQLNQWRYQNHYKPEHDDMISKMHGATNQAADILLQTAMAIAPVPKLGLFGSLGGKLLGNARIPIYRVYGGGAGRFGNSWTFINPKLYGSSFRNFAGLPTVGLRANSGTLMIQGSTQIKNISNFRMALPLHGNIGRLVPELVIKNSWNTVKWSAKGVSKVGF